MWDVTIGGEETKIRGCSTGGKGTFWGKEFRTDVRCMGAAREDGCSLKRTEKGTEHGGSWHHAETERNRSKKLL